MTDTSTDAWNVESFAVEPEEGKSRFHDFGLPKASCMRSQILGFIRESHTRRGTAGCLNGEDIVAKAQTGTGKTAAFLISIIDTFLREPIDGKRRTVLLALILATGVGCPDCRGRRKFVQVHEVVGGVYRWRYGLSAA